MPNDVSVTGQTENAECCDWVLCTKAATGRLIRRRRQRRNGVFYERPAWTAPVLFFCDEHGEAMQRDPSVRAQRRMWRSFVKTGGGAVSGVNEERRCARCDRVLHKTKYEVPDYARNWWFDENGSLSCTNGQMHVVEVSCGGE